MKDTQTYILISLYATQFNIPNNYITLQSQ